MKLGLGLGLTKNKKGGSSGPTIATSPVISGDATGEGNTLTLTTAPVWTGATSSSYVWQRNGVDIVGSTNSTTVVVQVGENTGTYRVKATGTNAEGSTIAYSNSLNGIAAPTSAGALADQSFTDDTGTQTYDVSGDFTGVDLTYSLPTTVSGVTINSSTGVVSFDTNALAVQSGTSIVARATNNAGTADSGFSLDITAAAATAPGQVTGLTATAGDTQVSLSWSAPASDGGSAITDYLIEVNIAAGGWNTVTDGVSTSTSYVHTGLTNGSEHVYRVSAINAIGTGTASATDSATPSAETAHNILVSSVAELEDVMDGTTPVSANDVIAFAPGTYDLSAVSFSNQPSNVTWLSQFNANRANITNWSLAANRASGTFTMKQINIRHTLSSEVASFWSPHPATTHSIINGGGGGAFTSITLEDIDCDGGMDPFLDGGRVTHNNAFLYGRNLANVTVTNCTIYNVMTGLYIDSWNTATISGCEFYAFHADPIDLLNSQGNCQNITIKNNHFHSPSGSPSFFHMDMVQFQPTAASGNSFSNVDIYGNTASFGAITPVSEVNASASITSNNYTTSFSIASSEHGMVTVVTPTAGLVVTMPAATTKGEKYSFRYNTGGSGSVTFSLNGADTYEGGSPPTLTTAGDFATFISDGAGNWTQDTEGFRTQHMRRDYDCTLGDLEDGFVTFVDASGGNRTITLPATGTRSFHIGRIDNSANTVTVAATGGDTIALNGSTPTSVTMSPGYGLTITRTGDGNWTATEEPHTQTFVFSNGNSGNWSDVTVHGNISAMPGQAIRIQDEAPGCYIYNNTILPFIIADQNGDGVIGIYEGNQLAQLMEVSGATAIMQNNVTPGTIDVSAYGAAAADVGNLELSLSDSDPIPSSVTDLWNGTTRTDFVKTTRADVITAALAKASGGLDGTFIGAVGTTSSNGYYDFSTGQVNSGATLPNPTITTTVPADNATEIAADSTITITFDQAITAGTGNVTLRAGGSAVETFNIATGTGDNSGTVAISRNVLTITPGASMAASTEHAVQIAATAIDGTIYGTSFAGITDDTTLSFTTAAAGLSFSDAITDSANNSVDMEFTTATTTRGSYEWATHGGTSDVQRLDTSGNAPATLYASGSYVVVCDVRKSATPVGNILQVAVDALGGNTFTDDGAWHMDSKIWIVAPTSVDHYNSADVSSLYGESADTVRRIWMAYTFDGTNTRALIQANVTNKDIDHRRFCVFSRSTFNATDATMDSEIAALTP